MYKIDIPTMFSDKREHLSRNTKHGNTFIKKQDKCNRKHIIKANIPTHILK